MNKGNTGSNVMLVIFLLAKERSITPIKPTAAVSFSKLIPSPAKDGKILFLPFINSFNN